MEILSSTKTLKHLQEYVCSIILMKFFLLLSSTQDADSVGLLLACFHDVKSNHSYSIVQVLQSIDCFGEYIHDEFDCPLLSLTDLLYCIPSKSITHSVSVVHNCTSSCTFLSSSSTKTVEHELIATTQLVYHHDPANKMFCFNVYCMGHH